MRSSRSCLLLVALATALAWAAPARAQVPHTVAPGETLWSIAAANNFTTGALAAANGLSEDAQVVVGTTIQIPSEQEAAAALGTSGESAAPSPTTSAPPPPAGAYAVRPGDTLSGIAARSGVSTGQLAWMNGLDPSAPLLVGTALKLPTAAPIVSASPPAEPAVVVPAEPYASEARLTSAEIGGIAEADGVSPSLASAIAWQESGFNNGVVSSANARGVMQLLPGTWTWVQDQLAGPLDPASAHDNVHAGVMYLRQLLADANGDEALAIASYYQGAASVRSIGMLPETQRYVADVMALRARFGP